MKKLETDLEQIKTNKDSLAVTSSYFQVELNNKEKKPDKKKLKSSAIVWDSMQVEKEWNDKGLGKSSFKEVPENWS